MGKTRRWKIKGRGDTQHAKVSVRKIEIELEWQRNRIPSKYELTGQTRPVLTDTEPGPE